MRRDRPTLDTVIDLVEYILRFQLYLVCNDIASQRCPVHGLTIVPKHPLCTDVSIHLDRVRIAIAGRGG